MTSTCVGELLKLRNIILSYKSARAIIYYMYLERQLGVAPQACITNSEDLLKSWKRPTASSTTRDSLSKVDTEIKKKTMKKKKIVCLVG
ncbi:hypothetical protein ElyMa_001654300 [Elysia marginata]|uniref:Uncharacterized protein n=1 Tax=Elysia marginata TaxID=1093978 RepID=A0AAV4JQT9_9GAST|nr:hypothetical protein ElyMa_001654300 [Elysia marginata]